jgi:hypothetical protein
VKTRKSLAAALVLLGCASILPEVASADPKEVQREMREGARSVDAEKREAAREIRQCETRDCVVRETREGQREVNRERTEARNEIRRERDDRYSPPAPWQYRDTRYYYADGRYHDSHYYSGSGAHYHPGGKFCRDARHVAHLRDGYYRDYRRWYRDGRYWNEHEYVNRYYSHNRRDDDDNDDLMRGVVIGAAVVGIIAAVHEANDGD